MEYITFRAALAVFAIAVSISFSIWVFDTIKAKAVNAAEKWNEIYSDSKEEK